MTSVDLPAVLPFRPARISVQQYHRLIRAGTFSEYDRVELLNGVVTEKVPKNPRYRTATRKCDLKLSALLESGWHVQNQEPITLANSEPEPDVAVVHGKLEDYSKRHPGPADVSLVVEVADTSLVTDRFKAEIYAQAGIAIYWIVNLSEQLIEVYSQPVPDADSPRYEKLRTYRADDEIPVVVDGVRRVALPVKELLS